MTTAQRFAMTTRPDLLAAEAAHIKASGRNWRGRLADLDGYGTSGGSARDRRLIVEAMASLEAEGK